MDLCSFAIKTVFILKSTMGISIFIGLLSDILAAKLPLRKEILINCVVYICLLIKIIIL